jgi:hypothetical protein
MDTIDNALIELKCLILDILYQKKLEGKEEVPVLELLEDLGMTESNNLTGLDPKDTISLTGKALLNIEATKSSLRRNISNLH